MRERRRAWLVAALLLVLGAADVEAQGRSNLPGGNNQRGPGRRRQPSASPWNVPDAGADKAPPVDDSFFETMGGGAAPLGPTKSGAKKPRGKKTGAGKPGAGKAGAKGAGAKAPPPDPMKAADQVTATADHLARLDESQQQMLREHFRVCDLDENGWLSLREAEVTLALDRGEFRRTDANQDGRLDPSEFAGQKELMLARLGVRPGRVLDLPADEGPEPVAEPSLDAEPELPAGPVPVARPEPAAESTAPVGASELDKSELRGLYPRPSDLVARYDEDGGKALDAPEVERFFAESGLTLVPDLVVDLYDRDDSGGLEAAELYPLAWMAAQRLPAPPSAAPADPLAGAAPETGEPGQAGPQATDASAKTLGGLTHFGRLDPDRDGFVTEAELRKLQSPVRLEIRLRALLSSMDQDGDGRLSETEFRASMGDVRR